VIEADPPRRLSYSWHTLSPALAETLDLTDEARERITAERRSKVTFDIEALDELVKLTVVHDRFDERSLMAQLVTGGWPAILSNLKTLLETGTTLPLNQEPPAAARLGLTRRPPDGSSATLGPAAANHGRRRSPRDGKRAQR